MATKVPAPPTVRRMLRTAEVRGEVVSSLVRMVMPLCKPLFAPAVTVAVVAVPGTVSVTAFG